MNRLSQITLLFIFVFIFAAGSFYYPKWKQGNAEATISWDVSGYYFYLPAVFIYKDVKQVSFGETVLSKYHPTPDLQQVFRHHSGNYVMKYTAGQAVLFSPFFFIGHAIAGLSDRYPADGFSFPYQVCIGIGMLLYACLGLYVLRKVLLYFFSDTTTAITLLVVFFASNYLNYSVIDGAMTHNTLFLLYASLLLFTIRFYEKPSLRYAIAIGFTAGLATLVRPTEVICVIIPLCWNIVGVKDFKERISFIRQKITIYLSAAFVFLLIVSIQSIYWKIIAGEWFVYTYRNEGFDWLHPHIIHGLFSFNNGWLIYSPVLLLTIIGFVFLFRTKRQLFVTVSLFTCIFIYTCFSWQQWWYGASLGQRAMIQSYPVLALPLASFFSYALRRQLILFFAVPFLVMCTWYNLWMTHQAHRGGYFRAGEMNEAYLRAIFLKNNISPDAQLLLDNQEVLRGRKEPIASQEVMYGPVVIDSAHPFSKEYDLTVKPGTKWIRAYASVMMPVKEWDLWKMPQFIMRFYKDGKIIKTNFVRVSRVLSDGEKKEIHFDAALPQGVGRCTLLFWNEGSKALRVDWVTAFCF